MEQVELVQQNLQWSIISKDKVARPIYLGGKNTQKYKTITIYNIQKKITTYDKTNTTKRRL